MFHMSVQMLWSKILTIYSHYKSENIKCTTLVRTTADVNWDERELLRLKNEKLSRTKFQSAAPSEWRGRGENLNQNQCDSPRVFISAAPPLCDLVTVPVLSARAPIH